MLRLPIENKLKRIDNMRVKYAGLNLYGQCGRIPDLFIDKFIDFHQDDVTDIFLTYTNTVYSKSKEIFIDGTDWKGNRETRKVHIGDEKVILQFCGTENRILILDEFGVIIKVNLSYNDCVEILPNFVAVEGQLMSEFPDEYGDYDKKFGNCKEQSKDCTERSEVRKGNYKYCQEKSEDCKEKSEDSKGKSENYSERSEGCKCTPKICTKRFEVEDKYECCTEISKDYKDRCKYRTEISKDCKDRSKDVFTNFECSSENSNEKVIKIACSAKETLAITNKNNLFLIPHKIGGISFDILDVIAGLEHWLLLDKSGNVYSFGRGR